MAAEEEYYAALAADKAWSDELQRLFGRNAGDVRYTARARTGPTLEPLYKEFRRTTDAWYAALDAARGAEA